MLCKNGGQRLFFGNGQAHPADTAVTAAAAFDRLCQQHAFSHKARQGGPWIFGTKGSFNVRQRAGALVQKHGVQHKSFLLALSGGLIGGQPGAGLGGHVPQEPEGGPGAQNEDAGQKHAQSLDAQDGSGGLGGQVVGTVDGFTYGPDFDRADGFIREGSKDDETSLRKLLLGRATVILGGEANLLHAAATLGVRDRVRILPTALEEQPRYAAFRRDRAGAEKTALLQPVLARMTEDGRIDRILDRFREE